MNREERPFGPSYPLSFLLRTTGFTALACVLGLGLMRFLFSRELGNDFAPAFQTLRQLLSLLLPSLVFCALSVLLVASVAVFVVAVFASHKVAGPLFRLQRVAGYLSDGILVGHIHLRAGDQGKPVAHLINDWCTQRKQRLDRLHAALVQCDEALNRWESTDEIKETARSLQTEAVALALREIENSL